MPYNPKPPNAPQELIDPNDLKRWYAHECRQVEAKAVRHVLHHVAGQLAEFIRWTERALLLWRGCVRKRGFHNYPGCLQSRLRDRGIQPDRRNNGPAIAAFLFANGVRPMRFGRTKGWAVHHIYSGKFPYIGREATKHAVRDPNHFTQSAGLVAIHPVADALADEYPFFAWRLRFEAFRRFAYDPDGVFSRAQDELGFAEGNKREVVFRDPGCE